MSILSSIWGWISDAFGGIWIQLAIGTVVVAVVGWLWMDRRAQIAENKALQTQLIIEQQNTATAKRAAVANLQYSLDVQDNAQKTIAAIVRLGDAATADARQSSKIIDKVRHEQAQPLSPVLRCYLEQLRDDASAGRDGSSGSQACSP